MTWRELNSKQVEGMRGMDTKTLVVGQYVGISSGYHPGIGKVVKVSPNGVEVDDGNEILHFNTNGISDEWTHECGPWQITDLISREKYEATLEVRRRGYQAFVESCKKRRLPHTQNNPDDQENGCPACEYRAETVK